ncbi:hypothetical protein KR054_009048, partial [Drosophila jambulina]
QFSGPGSIPNAVEQYNIMRGAELAEMRRRKERPSVYPVFCKVRCPASDVNSMVTTRDVDVVTQLSLDSCTAIINELDDDDDDDNFGDEGIECEMGDSERLCGGAELPPKARGKGKAKARKIKGPAKSSKKDQQRGCQDPGQNGDFLDKLTNLHLEVCAELQSLVDEEVKKPSPSSSPRAKKVARKIKRQNTKRQEGGAPQKSGKTPELSPRTNEQVCYEDYYLPQPKWVDIMPSAMMSQGIKVNVCTCPAATPESAFKFMEQYGSMEPESLTPFFQEDSDLDHEFADRKGYLRYVEPRPRLDDDTDFCNKAPENVGSPVDPCFVELERRPYKVSLLRSLSPMRYTSQHSELAQKPAPIPVPIPSPSQAQAIDAEVKVLATELNSKKRRPRKVNTARSKPGSKANATPAKGRLPAGSQPEGKASLNPIKQQAAAPPPATAAASPPAAAQTTMPKSQQKRRKVSPLVIYSKSLENLKSEKMRIYNKISFTHERLIGALDRLQISLLQLPSAPQRSVQEQERRQRNAFEFCVRFARNFLYPLKGMIEDVRLTPVASFNSAMSNDASHRVMCVYGLMLQSLQTYQRQLRFFLLEKVAQKLSALIEMIYTMTNCCLEKNILARHDPVVESLMERCTRFLGFIEDMQEERIKLVRETERRGHIASMQQGHHVQGLPRSHHRRNQFKPSGLALAHPRQPRHPKQEKIRSHDRYDLKMCLNDFKVYEPRVVPKERPRAAADKVLRRRRRNPQGTGTTPVADAPSELQSVVKDDVRTQVQIQAANKGGGDSTSSMSLAIVEGHGKRSSRGVSPLREAMLEAVRRATPSQLQKVLDPMMRSLKTIMNEKTAKIGDAQGPN